MIKPLLLSNPSDSLPYQSTSLGATEIVKNTVSGLNIPANQAISAGSYYQTSDFIFSLGYDVASLLLWVTANVNVEVMAIPVSAANTSQQLDGLTWGSISGGGYVRITSPVMPGVFGFFLRFLPQGNSSASLIDVLELQLSKQ